MQWILIVIFIALFVLTLTNHWLKHSRKYESLSSVASSYDSWTNDRLLENLWENTFILVFTKNQE